jgi:hypothetical protein
MFHHLYNFFSLYKLEQHFAHYYNVINLIYVIKLLTLIGFYPNTGVLVYLGLYEDLTSLYIDFDNPQKVESLTRKLHKITKREEKKIRQWILSCIESHPSFTHFKTVNL